MESNDLSQAPFGELLKAYRKRTKLTQRRLAAKLDVHYNTVWAWEQGDHLPDTRGLVLELTRHLGLNERETRQLLQASLTTVSGYWQVPYQRNPCFTGREELLARLHTVLYQQGAAALTQSYALHGLGGIGKTQLAVEYAYRHALSYAAVFWINAETAESILTSFSSIAALLRLAAPHESDQSKLVAQVGQWLASHRDWLLLVDNVEDPELVKRFLPATRHGSLLFMTRRQALGMLAHPLKMEPMTVEEGRELLLRRARRLSPGELLEQASRQDLELSQDVVEAMGGLPLAIDQAGAFLEETQCTLADYLQLYQATPLALLDERDGCSDHPASVTRTFVLAFEKIQQHNPEAAELLRVCAYLSPDAIPEGLIIQGTPWLGSTLQRLTTEPRQYHVALKDLLAYSLLRRNGETKTLTIHRLVQIVLKETMPKEVQKTWARHLIQAIDQVFPAERLTNLTLEHWRWCEQLLPHALICTTLNEQREDRCPEVSSLLMKTANYLRDRARYVEAGLLYQRALTMCKQKLGLMHPLTASAMHNLALLFVCQGKDEEAEPLCQQALSIREQRCGSDHPDTASSLSALASLFYFQERYAEAESLYQRALSIREQVLGPSHLETAQSLDDLASLFYHQKRYAEAEPLFERALFLREQALGSTHPTTAVSLNNLAALYRQRGKYVEAEPLLRQALASYEQTLGPTHPNIAVGLHNLALLYQAQGKDTEVESLLTRALTLCELELGTTHPNTVARLDALALFYRKQGKHEEAALLFHRTHPVGEQEEGARSRQSEAVRRKDHV